MKKIYIHILVFLSFAMLFSSTRVAAQETKEKMKEKITIESVVKDEKGNPIKGATIYGNGGAVVTKTDASGKFIISIPDQTELYIEADNYESALFMAGEYNNIKEFSLKASLFLYGEKDVINIAFGKVKRGDIVNSVSVLNPDEILQYDNIQSITDILSGRVPGLYGSSNIRGIGTPLYIIDGLPRDISTINLTEVDQITVLKDINSSILYGSAAVNGVILITTKRGQAHKQQIKVTAFSGMSKPTSLPKYLSSAEYMPLYNEARVNDGLEPLYSQTDIENYTSGNKYRYPSVDYYSDEYLKSSKPFFSAITELSGGNDVATYYSNLGWDRTGSLLDFGEGKNGGQNKFNIRGNVDVKINSFIKSSLDAFVVINSTKGPVGNYWSSASTLKPNLFSPLIPFSLIDPDNSLLTAHKNDVDGMYLLGGTISYLTHPIADGYSAGVNENIQRTTSLSNRIDFDLDRYLKGLSFHTNFGFDFYSGFDQAILNTYSVYQPAWYTDKDSIQSLTLYGKDARSGIQSVSNPEYKRRFGLSSQLGYDRTFADVHQLIGSLSLAGNKFSWNGELQGYKDFNLGLRLAYSYDRRYMVDFSSAYVNSVKLPEGNRTVLSPSLGLAWAITSEDFMSAVSAINYLKLRVSAGSMNSDAGISGFYYYDEFIRSAGSFYWNEGNWSCPLIMSSFGRNDLLAFEKRKEINLGLEGILFDQLLSVDANIFSSVYSDVITKAISKYPDFYTDFIPNENNDINAYRGAELGLSINKSFGNLSLVIGANFLYATSEVIKKDEIYAFDYQNRTGKPVDAIFGMVDKGFYMDAADIANSPLVALGQVQPGDIKYVDQNNDNFIDSNDEIYIGRWQSPFSYGLNLKIVYKNFTLFSRGMGYTGGDGMLSNNYYWVDGNDKYSEFILNRWTEANKAIATFPRLSSLANSNNFCSSTFWLYNSGLFNIDKLQLTYNMPDAISKMIGMKNLSFFLNGYNLLRISKNKDIMELRIGAEPSYRSYSIGVKTVF